jgi:hypothetical protein
MRKIILISILSLFTIKMGESSPKLIDNTTWIIVNARIDYFNDLRLKKDKTIYHQEILDSFIINPN